MFKGDFLRSYKTVLFLFSLYSLLLKGCFVTMRTNSVYLFKLIVIYQRSYLFYFLNHKLYDGTFLTLRY